MSRSKTLTLSLVSVFLLCGVVVSNAQQRVSSEPSSLQNQSASDEVDRMLEGLKLKREDVVTSCLENCEQQKSDKVTGGGIVNKVQPQYPAIARAAHASGDVAVLIVIDEEGKVIAAKSVNGHPLLQAAALKAAKDSTFKPYFVDGAAVKIMGTLTYNFVLD